MTSAGVIVREALEEDVSGIREIFVAVYGDEYPYEGFLQESWLKRSVFVDDILMLVAVDEGSGRILGTGSVVFDVGAHSDLIGELGRLAVHPDARGRGIGKRIMEKRLEFIQNRLHVALVENRAVHSFSQRISVAHGFSPVGFLPMKHLFRHRESIALFARHFAGALALRKNHPRIVPEAHALAHQVMTNLGLPFDAIIDEKSRAYPRGGAYAIEELTAEGIPALVRIERGRLQQRELFGPMRLTYGFFKLTARKATYLISRETHGSGPVCGAVGYIHDELEKTLRVFELISRNDDTIRVLLEELLERCQRWGVEFVEVDVSAHAPRMQRTLVELGFLPAAYLPAMVFCDVERLDVVKMVRLLCPIDLGEINLTPGSQVVADLVMRAFTRQAVLPRVAEAVHALNLFSDLDPEQTSRVAGVCSVDQFEAGEALFQHGDPPEYMYIVIEGQAEIRVEHQAPYPRCTVGEIGRGESVGELSLLTGEPHSAAAVAKGRLLAATLSRHDLADLSRQRPDIAATLYRNLAVGLGRKLQRLDRKVATGRMAKQSD